MKFEPKSIAALVLCVLTAAACGDEAVVSHWNDRGITVDGDHADWEGRLTFVEDAKASVGIQNDGQFVYVAIVSADRNARMQIMRGMNLWFDPTQDKQENFGVRFPIVDIDPGEMREVMQSGGDMQAYMEDVAKRTMESDWLEVLGNSGMSLRVRVEDAHGIEARLGEKNGAVVYELKVPLQHADISGYSVGMDPGGTLQMGFVSEQLEFRGGEGGRGKGSGRGGGGGRGGRGGGGGFGGPGGGGGRPPSDFERPDPVDVWVKVQLAAQ